MTSPRLAAPLGLLLLLAVMATAAVSSLRGKSATYDEGTHLTYGTRSVRQGTFQRPGRRFDSTMPVSALNALAAEAATSSGEEIDPRRRLFFARLPSVVLGLAVAALAFAWSRELFGVRAGLTAAALAAFCPNLLAHSRLVTTDVGLTLGFFASVYLFWRYLERPGKLRLAVAALAFGLAQLTKVTALFLLPVLLLVVLLRHFRPRMPAETSRRGLSRQLGALAVLCAGAVVAVNAGFLFEGSGRALDDYRFLSARMRSLQELPLLSSLPLPVPAPYLQGVDMVAADLGRDRWTYLLGEYHRQGSWSYYLVAFGLKTPLGLLGMLGLAAFLGLGGRVRARGAEAALLVPAVFLGIYLSLFNQYQIGLRHLLPAFPFLFVSASRVAAWRPAYRSLQWLAALLLAAHVLASLQIHPHYLAYFNELAGGPLAGWRYLIDSNLDWGQDRAAARHGYAAASPVPVLVEPGGPVAGRILVSVNRLVGLKPGQSQAYAWLRENFRPVDHVGYSWHVYDVSEEALAACCADSFQPLPAAAGNLAPLGRPIGGGRLPLAGLERINDGNLGSGSIFDAAFTRRPSRRSVEAWFGIDWGPRPRRIDRLVVYPALAVRGESAGRFLAAELQAEAWDGSGWREIPGSRIRGNADLRVELRFGVLTTEKVRVRILGQRDHRGRYHAACLELAAFAPAPEAVP